MQNCKSRLLRLAAWTIACLLLAAPLPGAASPAPSLNSVLTSIDRAAPRIHSIVASASSTKYTKIVDDSTTETGTLYFQKTAKGPLLNLDITQPAPKVFIYRDETGWMYQPTIHQVEKFDLSQHRSLVQQFLLLGLGSGGHVLLKSFQVRLLGQPTLHGKRTIELLLTPKDPNLARNVTHIELWFDPQTWVAVQQKFDQPSGDYQMLQYSNPRVNARIPGERFSTRFSGATVVVPKQ